MIVPTVRRRLLILRAIGLVTGVTLPPLFQSSAAAKEGQPYWSYNRDPTTNVRYIRPGGAGRRSGSSWGDAAALSDIDEMIRLVGPGGSIYLLADSGPYRLSDPIWISHGGTAGKSIKIMGVNGAGAPAKALLIGNRTSPYPTTRAAFAAMRPGKDVFRLKKGADYLHFSFLRFENIGNGAFLVKANIADLTLEDIVTKNVQRFFECASRDMCTITGFTARRITVEGFSKSAFHLDGDTSNVLMDDIYGDSQRQDFDNFAEGIDISGNVHDVIFRRCVMRNSHQTLGQDEFWNGDGFTSEKDTDSLLFEDCEASGCSDGGFDLKTNNVTMRRCKSSGNGVNYKLWGKNVKLENCISTDPKYFGGTSGLKHLSSVWGANVTATTCQFTDTDSRATVFWCDVELDYGPDNFTTFSTITVDKCKVSTLGKLSLMHSYNSRITIDGVDQPVDKL